MITRTDKKFLNDNCEELFTINFEGGNILGYCNQNGIRTTKDKKKAFGQYLKFVKNGDHQE